MTAPDPSAAPRGRRRSDVVATTVIAGICCAALVLYWFGSVVTAPGPRDPNEAGQLISSMYDPPTNAIENALVKGDGQLFAGQSTDPLARHPEMVRGGPNEQAYRYQRPMYGWLGWIASGGQPGNVAWGLVAVTAASVLLLVYASASWLAAKGADPRWALTILAMPGVFVDLTWVGPEALGVALAVLGLRRWMRPAPGAVADRLVPDARPDWGAVALFAAAGLCRETLLLVPFVLMVGSLVRRRLPQAVAAALSAAPYVLWVLYLKVEIGAWPKGSVGGRLSLVPFGGMFQAWSAWGPADWTFAVGLLALAVAALVKGRESGLRPIVAANLALAATLGEPVWHRFPDFGRVLLLVGVVSLLAVLVSREVRLGLAADAAMGAATGGVADDHRDAGALAPVGAADPAT